MHPKPIEAKRGDVSNSAASAADQCRSPRRCWNRGITEADNTNTPAHA